MVALADFIYRDLDFHLQHDTTFCLSPFDGGVSVCSEYHNR